MDQSLNKNNVFSDGQLLFSAEMEIETVHQLKESHYLENEIKQKLATIRCAKTSLILQQL